MRARMYIPLRYDWNKEKWEDIHKKMDLNFTLLSNIDKVAKKQKQLLWRFISRPVADGSATVPLSRPRCSSG